MTLVLLIIIFIMILSATIKIYSTFSTVWCQNKICLVGKIAIVTGANTGIGYETALEFAKRGARVILACRNQEKAEAARLKILNETGNKNIVVKLLDLSSFASVRSFVKNFNETEERLDILVNNAGVLEVGKNTITGDGHCLMVQVNYLSPFLLTLLLIERMKESRPSRIVNVSSIIVKYAYNFEVDKILQKSTDSYKFSKLGLALFTVELARRIQEFGVTVYSADPGVVDTEIFKQVPESTLGAIRVLQKWILKSSERGAQTSIYCATEKGIEKYSGENFIDCQIVKRYKTVAVPELSKRLWDATEGTVQRRLIQ